MTGRYIATEIPAYPGYWFSAIEEEDKIVSITPHSKAGDSLLNNIYIGRIQNIVRNIRSAFIEIAPGMVCYASLDDLANTVVTNRPFDPEHNSLRIGDEVVVQVVREALKTKQPAVSGNISLSGRYMVLVKGSDKIGVSSKLSEKTKSEIKSMMADRLVLDGFGYIVRTNAAEIPAEELIREAERLRAEYEDLYRKAGTRTVFSCLYHGQSDIRGEIKGLPIHRIGEVLTDMDEVADVGADYFPVRRYADPMLPLYKLKSLEAVIEEASRERIWLKSGGYLVIQPTEALTVIDVNTGKYSGKGKQLEETFLKINLEAARESARQMLLRNLSGIILIDFIDMPDEYNKILEQEMKNCLKKDPLKAVFVDFTRLNLAEITRQKLRPSFGEIMHELR